MSSFKNKKNLSKTLFLARSIMNYPIHFDPYKILTPTKNKNTSNYVIGYNKEKNDRKINSVKTLKKNKNFNKMALLKKMQKDKIDILINTTFHKMNNNIRNYNLNDSNRNLQLKPISNEAKNNIKDNIVYKYQNFLRTKNNFTKRPEIDRKEYEWSKIILERKKLRDYRKIYSLKFIKIDKKIKLKLKNIQTTFNIV